MQELIYKGVDLNAMTLLDIFDFKSTEEEIEFKKGLVDSDIRKEQEYQNDKLKQKRKRKID